MRGLASSGVMKMGGDVHVLLEHSNRGKKSIGLDLTKPQGVEVVYKLAATCDVFLTNKLPAVRKKLRVEVDDIRSHNPNIIYVAGTGGGERGPDADRGGYDFLSYWCRAGSAMGCTPPDAESLTVQPGPGYGDSIGGMTIAGGIMGALFHRERTGEALTVDVSLLGVGLWAMGPTVALSLQLGMPWRPPPTGSGAGGPSNPLVGTYRTQDGGFIALSCLQGFHYWPGACRTIGQRGPHRRRPVHIQRAAGNERECRPRHSRHRLCVGPAGRMAQPPGRFRRPVVGGPGHSRGRGGPPGRSGNGYVLETVNAAGVPFSLVTAPVQFSGAAATPNGHPVQRASRRGAGRAGLRHRCHPGSGGGGCRGLRAGDIGCARAGRSTAGEFNTHALSWTPTTITTYFNGVPCTTDAHSTYVTSPDTAPEPFNQPFFLAFTSAFGMNNSDSFEPGTTPLPATMRIDWVRVWQC